MKSIFNMALSLVFLGIAGWIVRDIILPAEPLPLGGRAATDIDKYQDELDTLRQAQ